MSDSGHTIGESNPLHPNYAGTSIEAHKYGWDDAIGHVLVVVRGKREQFQKALDSYAHSDVYATILTSKLSTLIELEKHIEALEKPSV